MIHKELVLQQSVKNVLHYYCENVYKHGNSYNFRCNVCGDSKDDDTKRRAHIYTTSYPWMFHCYNCGYHASAENWIKRFFINEYKIYIREIMKMKNTERELKSIDVNDLQKKADSIKAKRKEKSLYVEKIDTSYFKPLIHYPELIEKFCIKRKIPEYIYSKWFFATDGFYKNRIIIPFYDNEKNDIYYFQGRSCDNDSIKYLSRRGEDLNSIYNFYNVLRDIPVVVLEGPIDSIFTENAIGCTGLKVHNKNLDTFPVKYFLLDNDNSGKNKSISLLKLGNYVFNWKRFLKDYPCSHKIKDVNDFIIHNDNNIQYLSFDLISKYFTNKIFDKIYLI